MKKFITLVLVLVLALGLTVPAMAFTSDTSEEEDHPFDLKIYLVEYDDNDLFGVATLPESDRGYAKNEIVAAIVELAVPKGEDPNKDYKKFQFTGDNVDFNVTDNKTGTLQTAGFTASTDAFTINSDGDTMTRVATTTGLKNVDKDKTYKWLFFAKVTGDEASLSAKLLDGTGSNGFTTNELNVTLDGTAYKIVKAKVDGKDGKYTITWTDSDGIQNEIVIDVDKNYKSTGMSIDPNTATGSSLPLGVNTKGELGIVKGAVVKTDGTEFEDVMDIYEDVVVDVFGMDYKLIGNYVRDSFFEDLVSADTIVATVDIAPWTAYVTVPDNIVVDPPKTGDAASIMGFVMVALSGAGVVALRKRG